MTFFDRAAKLYRYYVDKHNSEHEDTQIEYGNPFRSKNKDEGAQEMKSSCGSLIMSILKAIVILGTCSLLVVVGSRYIVQAFSTTYTDIGYWRMSMLPCIQAMGSLIVATGVFMVVLKLRPRGMLANLPFLDKWKVCNRKGAFIYNKETCSRMSLDKISIKHVWYFLCMYPILYLMFYFSGVSSESEGGMGIMNIALMMNSMQLVFFICSIIIVIPVVEEIIFRQYMYGYIKIYARGLGFCIYIIPSIMFTVMHNNALYLVSHFFLALYLYWVREKTNLMTCIVCHSVFNTLGLAGFLVGFIMRSSS